MFTRIIDRPEKLDARLTRETKEALDKLIEEAKQASFALDVPAMIEASIAEGIEKASRELARLTTPGEPAAAKPRRRGQKNQPTPAATALEPPAVTN